VPVALFLEFAAGQPAAEVRAVFQARRPPGLTALDLFSPLDSADPYLDDGAGPALIARLRFADADVAKADPGDLEGLGIVRHQVLASRFYPKAGGAMPDPEGAVSYLVQYRRPAADEAAFVAHYLKHHPPILLRLPGLYSLELLTPIPDDRPLDLPGDDQMLICDVSFASQAALNAALASDVRHELRRDFQTFPPFTGPLTHYAMARESVFRSDR